LCFGYWDPTLILLYTYSNKKIALIPRIQAFTPQTHGGLSFTTGLDRVLYVLWIRIRDIKLFGLKYLDPKSLISDQDPFTDQDQDPPIIHPKNGNLSIKHNVSTVFISKNHNS